MMSFPEATDRPRWLRGPIEGVPSLLQPVARALLDTADELNRVVPLLDSEGLRLRPGGTAPVSFHLLHIAGSTERLFAYAQGVELTPAQRDRLALEKQPAEIPTERLLAETVTVLHGCVEALAGFDSEDLLRSRGVGAQQLPSTVLGLLVHAAEHAQRHCGQVVTTIKFLAAGME